MTPYPKVMVLLVKKTRKRGLVWQTNSGLAQQAGANYTRRASRDSSCLSSHCPTHSNVHTHLWQCAVCLCVFQSQGQWLLKREMGGHHLEFKYFTHGLLCWNYEQPCTFPLKLSLHQSLSYQLHTWPFATALRQHTASYWGPCTHHTPLTYR